mmetsp:Transcript_22159/g.62292  ORF Transcript_22159/g.62292 Transcript_22159/m.62292 type:complete len:122 (-) Transcript_22159:186-551(-)
MEGDLRCSRCNDQILAVVYKKFGGGAYHTDCFRCQLCNGLCGNEALFKGGKMYCSPCVASGFASNCEKCGAILDGPHMEALNGRRWHNACFGCSFCSTALPNDFYVVKDNISCKTCAERQQ